MGLAQQALDLEVEDIDQDAGETYVRPGLEKWNPNAPDPHAERLVALFRKLSRR